MLGWETPLRRARTDANVLEILREDVSSQFLSIQCATTSLRTSLGCAKRPKALTAVKSALSGHFSATHGVEARSGNLPSDLSARQMIPRGHELAPPAAYEPFVGAPADIH